MLISLKLICFTGPIACKCVNVQVKHLNFRISAIMVSRLSKDALLLLVKLSALHPLQFIIPELKAWLLLESILFILLLCVVLEGIVVLDCLVITRRKRFFIHLCFFYILCWKLAWINEILFVVEEKVLFSDLEQTTEHLRWVGVVTLIYACILKMYSFLN